MLDTIINYLAAALAVATLAGTAVVAALWVADGAHLDAAGFGFKI